MKLAEQFDLDLDADINIYLKSWNIDENQFTNNQKVTIRGLLSHTSGVISGNFQGYSKTDSIPNTTEILIGQGNTPKVEVDAIPGSRFEYSGLGFVVLQQLVEDVSNNTFDQYFQTNVFCPIGMINSTFNQFPSDNIAIAHGKDGKQYRDGWRFFPELSAAGLWTTPTDLAKLCLTIENAFNGKDTSYISQKTAIDMLTPIKYWGLGVGIRGDEQDIFYFHAGANPGGYKCAMVDIFKKQIGMAIMTNGENGGTLHDEILSSFGNFYGWNTKEPNVVQPIELKRDELEMYVGKYQFIKFGEYFLEVYIDDENQLVLFDPNDGMKKTFLPIDSLTFIERFEGIESSFERDSITGDIKRMLYVPGQVFEKVK